MRPRPCPKEQARLSLFNSSSQPGAPDRKPACNASPGSAPCRRARQIIGQPTGEGISRAPVGDELFKVIGERFAAKVDAPHAAPQQLAVEEWQSMREGEACIHHQCTLCLTGRRIRVCSRMVEQTQQA